MTREEVLLSARAYMQFFHLFAEVSPDGVELSPNWSLLTPAMIQATATPPMAPDLQATHLDELQE